MWDCTLQLRRMLLRRNPVRTFPRIFHVQLRIHSCPSKYRDCSKAAINNWTNYCETVLCHEGHARVRMIRISILLHQIRPEINLLKGKCALCFENPRIFWWCRLSKYTCINTYSHLERSHADEIGKHGDYSWSEAVLCHEGHLKFRDTDHFIPFLISTFVIPSPTWNRQNLFLSSNTQYIV